VVSVFGTAGAQLFVNGKLSASLSGGETFNSSVQTMSLGAFLRNNDPNTLTDPFKGEADDVGLFDTGLFAADAALINGLGWTGAIGLDQLDEAQALNGMTIGSVGMIGGAQWQKVTGLAGGLGDFGGTVAGGNAFIVTDNLGDGIQVVPEPVSGALLAGAVAALALRRSRRAAR
jgi:hypothetical protein